MWETKYAREPINYRLMLLKALKKLWIFPLMTVVGALVIGGIYYLVKMVIGDGYIYRARSIYYVTYALDEQGIEKDYYNYYTWEEIANSEYFIDGMYNAMDGELSREYLLANTTVRIESDYRYLYSKSDSNNKQLSLKMEDAISKLVQEYADTCDDIEKIELIDKASVETIEDISLIFVSHAFILGAIIGLLTAIVFWVFYETVDTSVYLPSTLENRYGIMALGAPSMKEYEQNCREILSDKKVYKISVDGSGMNDIFDEKKLQEIKSAEAIVLSVKAGSHNGKRIERCLEQLNRLSISVTAFELVDEDKWLIEKYYRA